VQRLLPSSGDPAEEAQPAVTAIGTRFATVLSQTEMGRTDLMHAADEYVRISFRHEDFRVAFAAPFGLTFVWVLVVAEASLLLLEGADLLGLLVVIPITAVLVSAVATGLICLLLRFEVGPEGIKGYDFWSRPYRTEWESITHVRPVSMLGLAYLRFDVRGSRRSIWMPLFVERPDLLQDLLTTYMDDAHQLHDRLKRLSA
jgi:hypothetical protein